MSAEHYTEFKRFIFVGIVVDSKLSTFIFKLYQMMIKRLLCTKPLGGQVVFKFKVVDI